MKDLTFITMKKIIAFFVLGIMTFSFGAFAQIKVDNTGKVGINNTSPAYSLDVSGNFRVLQNGYEVIFSGNYLYPKFIHFRNRNASTSGP